MASTTAKRAAPRKAAAKALARKRPAAKPAAAAAPVVEAAKPAKRKLVRDSFTIPKDEYAVIDALKLRAGKLGRLAKKSELLRAGLKALAAMPDAALLQALAAVPPIKTGRPKGGKGAADAAKSSASAGA
ncbi:hypothetical protein [Piscinibacter sp. XHJ-5]|uniref:hypothetical protein n=1 Tax=Piscinibacter sp. XHJ-5 TaxID=3037797 RepID=UPI002453266A|nr:hypothetical protein [Piscinibacter sp. XHJ-5]